MLGVLNIQGPSRCLVALKLEPCLTQRRRPRADVHPLTLQACLRPQSRQHASSMLPSQQKRAFQLTTPSSAMCSSAGHAWQLLHAHAPAEQLWVVHLACFGQEAHLRLVLEAVPGSTIQHGASGHPRQRRSMGSKTRARPRQRASKSPRERSTGAPPAPARWPFSSVIVYAAGMMTK